LNCFRLAQAKTGTGKTLAFLVPVLQKMLEDPRLESRNRRVSRPVAGDVRAIVVSPTRELAEQIATEARKIVRNTGLVVQTAVGGTRKKEGLQRIQREGCHLLVGTPGRLIDILSDPYSGVKAPNLSAFVLDEADRLLDIGFAPEIARMQEYLPPRSRVDRQTLLFSATVPRGVMDVVSRTMKPDYAFVKTVDENEVPTHLAVPQKIVFLNGLENQPAALLELVKKAQQKNVEDPSSPPFKAIVYYNATAEVNLAYEMFQGLHRDLRGLVMTEMHSRLTQGQRTRNSEKFRFAKKGILFSSDVTARGMDFPNVTHVIQVGMPRDRESYVHRLGRTARANKGGEGWLLTTEAEYQSSAHNLNRLPIEKDATSLPSASVDMTKPVEEQSPEIAETLKQVTEAARSVDVVTKASAYLANLNLAQAIRPRRFGLQMVNNLATHAWGMEELPRMPSRMASMFAGGKDSDSQPGSRGYRHNGGYSRFSDRSSSSGYPRSSDRFSSPYKRSFDRPSGQNTRSSDSLYSPSSGRSSSSPPYMRSFDRSSSQYPRSSDRSSDRSSGSQYQRSFDRSSSPRSGFGGGGRGRSSSGPRSRPSRFESSDFE
jgi:ATP-dependent RNA helicase MSS116